LLQQLRLGKTSWMKTSFKYWMSTGKHANAKGMSSRLSMLARDWSNSGSRKNWVGNRALSNAIAVN
jgi:hypothetical protein